MEYINKEMLLNEEIEELLLYYYNRKKELKAEIVEIDDQINSVLFDGVKPAMDKKEMSTLKTPLGLSFTNKQVGFREVFDKKKLKEIYPEVYDDCSHTEPVEPTIIMRVTNKEG